MGNQHILPFGGCTPVRAVAHPKRFAVSVNDPNLSDCVKKEPVPGWLDAHYEGCAHSESHVHFGDSNFAYADPRIEPKEGFIYFISNGNGMVKIGKSVDPEDRLKALQTASPYALRLLLVLETEDMAGDEAYWHQQFAKDRVSENLEWFRYSKELKAFIESENESQ